MRKILLSAVLTAFSFTLLLAQPAHGDYRTKANGNMHSGTLVWERFDGTTETCVAAATPTALTANVTTILHQITATTTANIDQAVIASGGKLILEGSSFTTADGSGDD